MTQKTAIKTMRFFFFFKEKKSLCALINADQINVDISCQPHYWQKIYGTIPESI